MVPHIFLDLKNQQSTCFALETACEKQIIEDSVVRAVCLRFGRYFTNRASRLVLLKDPVPAFLRKILLISRS